MKKPRNRTSSGITRGAVGGPKKRSTRNAFLAESSRQGNRIANERALQKAYREFYATPEGRKFAKEFGRSFGDGNGSHAARVPSQGEIEFHDPADIPDSVGCGSHNGRKLVKAGPHPVDEIEPEYASRDCGSLSDEEIRDSSELFGRALRWALDAGDVVARGRRSIVMVTEMRADLGHGLTPYAASDSKSFHKALVAAIDLNRRGGSGEPPLPNGRLRKCGAVFGRYLEWMRRAPTVAGIGERLDLTAYVLRPDLLMANTLAKLGALVGKTRQAKDKLANCQRDTFSGIKALPMRADVTRDRCRASQLQRDVASN